MRQVHIGVLQEGDQDQGRIDYQVGWQVEINPGCKAEGVDYPSEDCKVEDQT